MKYIEHIIDLSNKNKYYDIKKIITIVINNCHVNKIESIGFIKPDRKMNRKIFSLNLVKHIQSSTKWDRLL